jgi:hypothetical protein
MGDDREKQKGRDSDDPRSNLAHDLFLMASVQESGIGS